MCHVWTSVTCGQESLVDKCHVWTSVTCGQMSRVDKCHMWTSVTCGQVSLVDKCHVWTSVTCGQVSRVDKCWSNFLCKLCFQFKQCFRVHFPYCYLASFHLMSRLPINARCYVWTQGIILFSVMYVVGLLGRFL